MVRIYGMGNNPATNGVAVVAYGLTGWALCGLTMGVGMNVTSLEIALIVHALAAPAIFSALSVAYFRRSGSWSPLRAAAAFVGVVVFMDVFVVALLVQRSFEMFGSVLGTWLPFLLIFIASWWTGSAVRRAAHRTVA